MFFDGDPKRPNCFEHYNPFTGQPSVYRGVDDYQHSWVVDLIIKYVAGVRPEERSVVIDPFPFKLRYFILDNVCVQGKFLKVERVGKFFTVWLDGKRCAQSTIGKSVQINV